MQKNILITGKPKSGKSTLLQKVIAPVQSKVGFLAQEVLGEQGRVGFDVETHAGVRAVLARVDQRTPYAVSKYFVDLQRFEALIPKVRTFGASDLLYIDEIGQMQLFSDAFKELVLMYLYAPNTCVATISCMYDDEFTKQVKERDDVLILEITEDNREEMSFFIPQLLKKIEKAKGYASEPSRFTIGDREAELMSEHGIRKLRYIDGTWQCTCDFSKQYGMCSHVIALKEVLRG